MRFIYLAMHALVALALMATAIAATYNILAGHAPLTWAKGLILLGWYFVTLLVWHNLPMPETTKKPYRHVDKDNIEKMIDLRKIRKAKAQANITEKE